MTKPDFRVGAALLLSLVVLPGGLLAQDERDDHSPVAKEMSTINRDLRKLSRQYTDPAQKDSTLVIVAEMQKSAEATKKLTPPQAEKLADAEKAKYMELYVKDMDALLKEFASLKTAVEAGENDKVKAELDQLNKLKMSSHKELGVKQGNGPGGGRQRGGGGQPSRGEAGGPPSPDRAPGAAVPAAPAAPQAPAPEPSPTAVSPAPVQP